MTSIFVPHPSKLSEFSFKLIINNFNTIFSNDNLIHEYVLFSYIYLRQSNSNFFAENNYVIKLFI